MITKNGNYNWPFIDIFPYNFSDDKKTVEIIKKYTGETDEKGYKKIDTKIQNELKQKWSLTSKDIDKILVENPKATVRTINIKLNKDAYFKSGSYEVTEEFKKAINLSLDSLLEGRKILIGVLITSSTDKQPLSKNLENKLKSQGFSTGNKGLSEARCKNLESYFISIGINDDIIQHNIKIEEGDKEIDPSARYVIVSLFFIDIPVNTESKELLTYDIQVEKKLSTNISSINIPSIKIGMFKIDKLFSGKKNLTKSCGKSYKCPTF